MSESIDSEEWSAILENHFLAIYDNWSQTHLTQIDHAEAVDINVDTLPKTFVLSVSDG